MSKPKGRGKSWRERQEADPYVREARRLGWRSRAVFKLEELLQKGDLAGRGNLVVIDLGAAPGGWSQYLGKKLNDRGQIIAVDILAMDELPGVQFIQGDFTEEATLAEIKGSLGERRVNLVISDMAPNISGTRSVDQPKVMYLAELALDLASGVLGAGGVFICKVFHGEGFDDFIRECRARFGTVKVRKPKASRDSSREVYVLARNYRIV